MCIKNSQFGRFCLTSIQNKRQETCRSNVQLFLHHHRKSAVMLYGKAFGEFFKHRHVLRLKAPYLLFTERSPYASARFYPAVPALTGKRHIGIKPDKLLSCEKLIIRRVDENIMPCLPCTAPCGIVFQYEPLALPCYLIIIYMAATPYRGTPFFRRSQAFWRLGEQKHRA